jgi:hypothetical protein
MLHSSRQQPGQDIVIHAPAPRKRITDSLFPAALRSNVPRHPAIAIGTLCRHCGQNPVSRLPAGPFPDEVNWLCEACRFALHRMCSYAAHRITDERVDIVAIMREMIKALRITIPR